MAGDAGGEALGREERRGEGSGAAEPPAAGEGAADRGAGRVRIWYLPLLAGLLPVLVGGFVASAVANRVAFAVWAVIAGAAYTALLRIGIDRGWERHARAAATAGLLAVAFAVFAGLAGRHREIFELGWRAVFGVGLAEVATRPGTWVGAAAVSAVVAVWQLGAWRALARRRALSGEAA